MKSVVGAVVLWAGLLCASAQENRFNSLVDEVIYEMKQDMINKSETTLRVPHLSQTFSKKILFFTLDGSVRVEGASVKNLSSIYRIGDVVPVQNDTTGSLSVEGTFGLRELSVSADMIDVKIGFLHVNDPLRLRVGDNAASFKVTLTFDEDMNCHSTLDYALVKKLGGFSISLGSGFFTDIEDHMADYIVNKLSPAIQSAINAHIFPKISAVVSKMDLCGKLL